MLNSDLASIRRARLLGDIPRSRLASILAGAFVQTLPAGAVLCRQGEKPDFLHVIVSGHVGLFGERESDEALIEIFGSGDAFIVPAVVLDMPSLLTARTLDESRILLWPAAAFRRHVQSNSRLAYGIVLQLSSYWRMLIGQLKDLKLLSATERLSNLLLSLTSRQRGAAHVMLPGNRTLVAGMLGVAPQSLSRAFASLRPLGVSGGGRQITISNVARLREVASPAARRKTPARARRRAR